MARLPDGVGTRLDVMELAKESQWLEQGSMDENLMSMTIGGGLDRLQAEEDPCCRFDPHTRLWVYLHQGRKADDNRLNFQAMNSGIPISKLDMPDKLNYMVGKPEQKSGLPQMQSAYPPQSNQYMQYPYPGQMPQNFGPANSSSPGAMYFNPFMAHPQQPTSTYQQH